MSPVDLLIVALYLLGMLGVGAYFLGRQSKTDQYFVGDRRMGAAHIGLSVVATDVGGGFSIGLGGLGYSMGLSGSWLLFTGLIGAWVAAVVVIPRVKVLGDRYGWLTYPQFLENRFDGRTRLLAAVVSGIGYAGFVGGQILAGAKLSSTAFQVDLTTAVWIMAGVVVLYTAFGGLQAVVYTDTVQWIILLGGLLLAFIFSWSEIGGLAGLRAKVPVTHLSLTHIEPLQLLTWLLTIVPIWFVGMTLYQRIYATKDLATARKAWFLAGLLEYPVMAFLGAILGVISRAMFQEMEPEMGLPLLIREVLPKGMAGLVVAAYFSAIMSTADSCLLAAVGHMVSDLYLRHIKPNAEEKKVLWLSRGLTLGIGLASVSVAFLLPKVLDIILLAYGFMVSGLFMPTLGGLLWKRVSSSASLWSILAGGGAAVLLSLFPQYCPIKEPILVALPLSALVLYIASMIYPATKPQA